MRPFQRTSGRPRPAAASTGRPSRSSVTSLACCDMPMHPAFEPWEAQQKQDTDAASGVDDHVKHRVRDPRAGGCDPSTEPA